MVVCVDFDGCLVPNSRPWDDIDIPLKLLPGAREGLLSLKRAGHTLLLYSARNNRADREDPDLDPLVRAGADSMTRSDEFRFIANERYIKMVELVEKELPGVFDAIDDGVQGKPTADMFIDDRAIVFGPRGMNWEQIAGIYGE